jgi:hypothetical protein
MYQQCSTCSRRYNDEYHSTVCPHRGIGFCAVCDYVVCVCSPETAGDWERSSGNHLSEDADWQAERLVKLDSDRQAQKRPFRRLSDLSGAEFGEALADMVKVVERNRRNV